MNIQNAKKKMVELSKVHERALMPSFGDGKEDHHAIDELTQDITNLLKRSEKRLMKLSSNVPSEDSNVRKNVQVVGFLITIHQLLDFCMVGLPSTVNFLN